MSRQDFPEDLIAISFDDDRGFICVKCIGENENVDDDKICTVIMSYDSWFHGEICKRCNNLVTRSNA